MFTCTANGLSSTLCMRSCTSVPLMAPCLLFVFTHSFQWHLWANKIGISLQLKAICLCACVEAWCAVSFHPGASVSVFFPSHTLPPSVCCLLLLGSVIPTFFQHPPDVFCSLAFCSPRLVTLAMASAWSLTLLIALDSSVCVHACGHCQSHD